MASNRESIQRAAQLSAILARHCDLPANLVAAHVLHLQRIARQVKAIAERQCNGYQRPTYGEYGKPPQYVWDQEWEDRDTKRYSKLKDRAIRLGGSLGVAVNVGGDPRGPCLRLVIAGERGDGFDEGYAVY